MGFVQWIRVIFTGIIGAVTKWLPISDTGHLLIYREFLGTDEVFRAPFSELTAVAAELGAVLALILLYFHKLNPISQFKTEDQKRNTRSLLQKILILGVPFTVLSAVVEFVPLPIFRMITENVYTVCVLFIGIGVALLVTESKRYGKDPSVLKISELSGKTLWIGGAVALLSVFAGAGHTEVILVALLLLSASRYVATEMAFYAAIPITGARVLLKLARIFIVEQAVLSAAEVIALVVIIGVSMAVSFFVIRTFLHYLKRHSLRGFGVYRIAVGLLALMIQVVR